MQKQFDAVIVGAGPAGSTAAILLARAGWSVALVEKQRFPRRKVCGECIAASNLPLLDALGLGPAFEAVAGPQLRQVALMHGNHQVLADLPAAPHARHRFGRALGRETLDSLLRDQAQAVGVEVLQPWSVQAMDGSVGAWRCLVQCADSGAAALVRARVAICAQGSWEPLPADRAGPRPARRAADLLAFKANFRGVALDSGVLPVLLFDGGYGGMVVADDGLATLACCIRRDRLEAARRASPGLRAGEVVEALLGRECAGVRLALHSARRDGPWLAAGPIAPAVHLGAINGPLRIGNAAGEAHPILGEGISMALQSAWLLCAQLLAGEPQGAVPGKAWQHEAARRYAVDWRRQFGPRLRVAAAFAHMAMRPGSAALLLALARRWPGLLTAGARWGGKVSCAADLYAIAPPAPAAVQRPLTVALIDSSDGEDSIMMRPAANQGAENAPS